MKDLSDSIESAQFLVEQVSEKFKQFATITEYIKVKTPDDGIVVEKRV